MCIRLLLSFAAGGASIACVEDFPIAGYKMPPLLMVIRAASWIFCGNICRVQPYFLIKLLCIHPVHIASCKVAVVCLVQRSLANTGWIDKGCCWFFSPQNTVLQQPNQAGWGKLGRPWGTARATTEPQFHQSHCWRCFQGTQKPACPVSRSVS